jgi:hypothetical protein
MRAGYGGAVFFGELASPLFPGDARVVSRATEAAIIDRYKRM